MRLRFDWAVTTATLTTLMLSAAGASAQPLPCNASPNEEQRQQAGEHMKAGVSFIKDPDDPHYEEAYPEFRKAYELSCSLNALQNLGLSALHLELDGEALAYYQRVLEKKGDALAAADRGQMESDVARLQGTTAWVTLTSKQVGVHITDERTPRRGSQVRNSYRLDGKPLRIGIHPGNHTITASAPGFPSQSWSVLLANGQTYQHDFKFEVTPAAPVPPPVSTPAPSAANNGEPTAPLAPATQDDSKAGMPNYVWIAGGVTLAAAVPMVVFMGMSSSQKSDYDANIVGKKSPAEQQQAFDDLQSTNLLADVFLGITAAGAVTTAVLALTAPRNSTSTGGVPGGTVGYTVTPRLGPHQAGVMFAGQF